MIDKGSTAELFVSESIVTETLSDCVEVVVVEDVSSEVPPVVDVSAEEVDSGVLISSSFWYVNPG